MQSKASMHIKKGAGGLELQHRNNLLIVHDLEKSDPLPFILLGKPNKIIPSTQKRIKS